VEAMEIHEGNHVVEPSEVSRARPGPPSSAPPIARKPGIPLSKRAGFVKSVDTEATTPGLCTEICHDRCRGLRTGVEGTKHSNGNSSGMAADNANALTAFQSERTEYTAGLAHTCHETYTELCWGADSLIHSAWC
jgi:hypothetical protein